MNTRGGESAQMHSGYSPISAIPVRVVGNYEAPQGASPSRVRQSGQQRVMPLSSRAPRQNTDQEFINRDSNFPPNRNIYNNGQPNNGYYAYRSDPNILNQQTQHLQIQNGQQRAPVHPRYPGRHVPVSGPNSEFRPGHGIPLNGSYPSNSAAGANKIGPIYHQNGTNARVRMSPAVRGYVGTQSLQQAPVMHPPSHMQAPTQVQPLSGLHRDRAAYSSAPRESSPLTQAPSSVRPRVNAYNHPIPPLDPSDPSFSSSPPKFAPPKLPVYQSANRTMPTPPLHFRRATKVGENTATNSLGINVQTQSAADLTLPTPQAPSKLSSLPFRNSAPSILQRQKRTDSMTSATKFGSSTRFNSMTGDPSLDLPPPVVTNLEMPHRKTPNFSQAISSIGNQISSRLSNRNGSPSIMSRISSRISINSRISSPSRSRPESSASVRSSSAPPLDQLIEPLDDFWPTFEPEIKPNNEVKEQIYSLRPHVLRNHQAKLVDIDPNAVYAPKTSLNEIMDEEKREARTFAQRGLYFYTNKEENDRGTTNEEGQYVESLNEHIGYRYRVVGKLGVGSFGSVLKCRDHKSGRMVAVKITSSVPGLQTQARIEASILRSLMTEHSGDPDRHHFVRYIEHFRFRNHLCIASELLGPNLYDMIKWNRYKGLNESTVKFISKQLAEGLDFLASKNIIHCDLKPENILVSDFEECQVKIIDFGSSCYEGKRLYTYIQSRFYRSPEILLGLPYGPAIDTWSYGAIVVELLLGRPVFPGEDESDLFALMCQFLGCPSPQLLMKCSRAQLFVNRNGQPLKLTNTKNVTRGVPFSTPLYHSLQQFSPEAVDFCLNLLKWSPDERLSAKRASLHPFLTL
ncbi:hypothetical protein DASB73_019570 [Starmerella bacillaris]|uniref:Protein kinase domain-containing protein n=1 Tax=Starmerella bacillaris TaxID=1247836 RepID=A0AAV5RHJ8_STABA|nr:hypothetical protein DASB73_019570 [Starmerella bacillaris]